MREHPRMADDVRETLIDDLELSVRAYELVQGLGVATLGELLDLPKIEIPEHWPKKVGQLVAAELAEAFESLGVEYAGALVLPSSAPVTLTVTGDVATRWQTIAGWLEAEQPEALALFQPPASAQAIADAEAALGVALPDDYKQFLAIHDGQSELAPSVGLGSLLPIAKVVEAKRSIVGQAEPIDDALADAGVRAVDYSPSWIPITRSARGRDYLCLDLDPAPGGTHGQIIEYIVDDSPRRRVANSFAELLALYFEQAQAGELDFESAEDD